MAETTTTTTSAQAAAAATTQGGALATTDPNGGALEKPQMKLADQLKFNLPKFAGALPAHIPAEQFLRVVITAIQNNPDLAKADRASLFNSCMRAASDGLLPDGREGALVIYNSKVKHPVTGKDVWIAKVQWMVMVAGLRKKVRNSGEIVDWNTQVVYAKDEFDYQLGDDPYIKHKPFMGGEPGAVIAAYSIARLKGGELSREVMTRAEIDKVRGVSKSRDSGPWVTWFGEMCRKAVARRHAKVLPMNTDLDDLVRRDDALYDLDGARKAAQAKPDVAQNVGDRLDKLIAGGQLDDAENGEALEADEENDLPPHDSETGEIIESAQGAQGAQAQGGPSRSKDTGDAPKAATEPAKAASEPAKELKAATPELLAQGEDAADRGSKVLEIFIAGAKAKGFGFTAKQRNEWAKRASTADIAIEKEERDASN